MSAWVLFLLIARSAITRGVRSPVRLGFLWALGVLILYGIAGNVWHAPAPAGSRAAHSWIWTSIPWTSGSVVFMGPIAIAFAMVRRRSLRTQIGATAGVGVTLLPVAIGVMLYLACMLALGCV